MPDSKYDLIANTYTAKEQSFAVCEVGDAKQPDVFYPQVKIMRWDNEVNFSARLVHEETSPEVSLVADKIQWIGDAVEVRFYEIGEGKEGGGYEFEIILKEPPKSNVISMTLQTKGLDFFYQPELTPEEVAHGANRPENVVGSYAVYHKTMAGDYTALGGKNYKAGKAFHIFRPRIEDAKGNWVWGVLNIDEKAGLLTVAIPQDFLNEAVYPVRHAAGLEFGYHTVGLSEDGWAAYGRMIIKSPTTPISSGVLNSISIYGKQSSGASDFCPALYSDVSGVPTVRLAYLNSGGTTLPANFDWIATNLSYSGITSGFQYWLGSMGLNGIRYKFDSVSNASQYWTAGNNWPDPWAGSAEYNEQISTYATYTPAGSAGQATAKRFGGVPHMAINKGVW